MEPPSRRAIISPGPISLRLVLIISSQHISYRTNMVNYVRRARGAGHEIRPSSRALKQLKRIE